MSHRAKSNPLRGRDAPVAKYDILAAIGVAAFGKSPLAKDLAHRLTVLIVARYNWAADELSIGRQQLANLWNVDERRVKRLMGELKSQGVLAVKRAGVRGRVTTYRLGLSAIIEITRPYWARLGRDFKERLEANFPPTKENGTDDDAAAPEMEASSLEENKVGHAGTAIKKSGSDASEPLIEAMKEAFPRHTFARWFSRARVEYGNGRIVLHVASKFVADYIEINFGDRLNRLTTLLHPEFRRIDLKAG